MREHSTIEQILGLTKPPIAISFLDSIPEDIPRWGEGPVPAGCTFWGAAMNGRSFYTVPSDHYNCAVGSFTHGIALPEERAHELNDTVSFMAETNYVAMSEVPGIPTLKHSPKAVTYQPVDQARSMPDVVVIAATPAQAMLLYEAAIHSGTGESLASALGRPACAVLPLTTNSGQVTLSLGCKGNRTFTGLPDEELYVAIPGSKWASLCEKVAEVHRANVSMGEHYSAKKQALSEG